MEKTYFILLPAISALPHPDTADAHMAFEVSDDSMADGSRFSYEPGDIVIGRQLRQQHWRQQVQIGTHDYVLVHRRDGPLLRRIIHHDIGTGTLILHPLNPCYCDWAIDAADVTEAYHVIKVERTKA